MDKEKIGPLYQLWQADECYDAYGNYTIRLYDGSRNGNTSKEIIATVYDKAIAESIVRLHNMKVKVLFPKETE